MHSTLDMQIMEAKEPAFAETLVLLHGFGFPSAVFKNLLEPLTQEFNLRVILIDLPGYDQNSHGFSLEGFIGQLLTQTPANAWWFGWSLGGLLLLQLALTHPEHLQGFITLGTSPKFLASNDWPGVLPQTMQIFKENFKRDFLTTLSDFLLLQGKSKRDQNSIMFLKQFIAKRSLCASDMTWGLDLLQTMDLRFSLTSLSCQGLCLFAQNDQLIPASIAQEVAQMSSYLETEILPQQGHASFLSEPALFLGSLKRFIHIRSPNIRGETHQRKSASSIDRQ